GVRARRGCRSRGDGRACGEHSGGEGERRRRKGCGETCRWARPRSNRSTRSGSPRTRPRRAAIASERACAAYNIAFPMEPRPIRLTVLQPNLAPLKLDLSDPTITLGRATECTVPIKDRYLSRKH